MTKDEGMISKFDVFRAAANAAVPNEILGFKAIRDPDLKEIKDTAIVVPFYFLNTEGTNNKQIEFHILATKKEIELNADVEALAARKVQQAMDRPEFNSQFEWLMNG
jgi:hypothetical protein